MRVAVLLLAGCGRLGFGDVPVDDAPADGVADTPTDTRPCVPLGHDDDADGIDDSCDVCPHLPADSADRDGDGVGDACDPNPDTATERIVRYEPFRSLPGDFVVLGPAPTFDDAGAQFDTRVTAVTLQHTVVPANDAFRIGLRLGAGRPAPNERQITIAMYEDPGYYYCELYDNGTFNVLAFTRTFDGASFASLAQADLTLTPVEQRDTFLEADHRPPITRCKTGWPATMQTISGTNPALTPAKIVIVLRGLEARLDYFVHIRTE